MPVPADESGETASTVAVANNPYDDFCSDLVYLQQQLDGGALTTSHVLMDLNRLVNDVIITTAQTFLSLPHPPPTPSPSSLTLHPSASLTSSTLLLHLRDANLLSLPHSLTIDHTHRLATFALTTQLRTITPTHATALITALASLLTALSSAYTSHTLPSPTSSSPTPTRTPPTPSPSLSIITPQTKAAKGGGGTTASGRPHGWSEEEWALHCRPLWNTAVLDLQKAEEEEGEREAAIEEERKERVAAVKERDRGVRERAKAKKEAAREREEGRRERAVDRAKRVEDGDIDADEAKKEEEEEAAKEAEGVGEGGEEEEKEEAIVIPPPVVKHTPLSFRCVSCHSVLLSAAHIARVYANTVYSKAHAKPPALFTNTGEQWTQLQAEADAGAEVEEADDGDATDSNAPKAELTSAVYCTGCKAYVGRHYARTDVHRLVCIDRLTGQNWMYVTGDMDKLVHKLTPLLRKAEAEGQEGEGEEGEEEEGEEGEERGGAKKVVKEEEIPPITGLPSVYVSPAQAVRYPFPRFPVPIIAASRPPPNPHFPAFSPSDISSLQAACPDPVYLVTPTSGTALTRLDASYTARLLLTVVTQHLLALFATFEAPTPSSPYHPPTSSPIPPFTHFYLSPPELTHARGTARYAFHYLTGKDDRTVKRHPWTLRRARERMAKWTCGVLMLMAGGWGGMRVVLVRVGVEWRVYQSNDGVRDRGRRYTLKDWVREGGRWGRVLGAEDMDEWFGKFERARRGDKAVWEDLFCRGDEVLSVADAPQDRFKETDCEFSVAELLKDNLNIG